MRIAIISFDQEFSKKIKESLGDEHQVRIYIDSLGMLRDLKEFSPDIIIYDASAGEFAIDDLKFLMTRDKLGNIEFKIFISKTEPINVDELPKKIPKKIYNKEEEDINKLIVELKSADLIEEDFGQDLLLESEGGIEEKKEEKETELDNLLSQSPEDIEDLLMGDVGQKEVKKEEEKPKKEEPKKEETPSKPPSDDIFNEDIPLEEIESILGEFSLGEEVKEEKPVEKEVKKEKEKEKEEVLDFQSEDIEELLGLSEAKSEEKKEKKKTVKRKEEKKVKKEDFLADIEDLLTAQTKRGKKEKEEKKKEESFETESIEDLISDIGLEKEEKIEEKVEKESLTETPVQEDIPVQEKIKESFPEEIEIAKAFRKGGGIKLEITISEEEIKRLIVNETVNRMVEELKNDKTLKELIENIQKDFIDRTEKELEGLKNTVKVEVKTKLLKRIEEDLKEKVKESIKKDVMEITTKLVKYKLEQLFGGK